MALGKITIHAWTCSQCGYEETSSRPDSGMGSGAKCPSCDVIMTPAASTEIEFPWGHGIPDYLSME